MRTRTNQPPRWTVRTVVTVAAIVASTFVTTGTAFAQDGGRMIELELIEIEAEVPRRVAQFFIQRDQLRYEPIDERPSFLPDLLNTVEEDPF